MWCARLACGASLLVIFLSLMDGCFANFCTEYYECSHTCYKQTSYTKRCGWLWRNRCTKYRSTADTCTGSCSRQVCCGGFTGLDCKTPVCFGHKTCPNGGKCLAPHKCQCAPGFKEPTCADINECANNNGGCKHSCENTNGSFRCKCRSGYLLETDKASCKAVCYGSTSCPNGGKCIGPDNCQCAMGFQKPKCDDINECANNNGGCEHSCENTNGSFRCKCRSGYLLETDKASCKAVCYGSTSCPNGGKCIGPDNCQCAMGFQKPKCDDINECANNNGGCEHSCENTNGSFRCKCRSGYLLETDKASCKAVCYGYTSCPNGGKCVGPDNCQCAMGFQKPKCDDINECANNNGGCNHTCLNTHGSFRCECRVGYQLTDDTVSCIDINECDKDRGGCEHTCTNTPGSFRCGCNQGYSINQDNRTCADIDECVTGTSGCAQTCTNTVGSYDCSCTEGYTLALDQHKCEDIDKCAANTTGCEHFCTNNTCSCKPGYALDQDGKTCNDVNECDFLNGGCEDTCTNNIGSYSCGCTGNATLNTDGKSCSDECAKNNGGCEHTCTNTPGSFRCGCKEGYCINRDERTCADIDECKTRTSGCAQTCTNAVGSYECSCAIGYTLADDKHTCIDITKLFLQWCRNETRG